MALMITLISARSCCTARVMFQNRLLLPVVLPEEVKDVLRASDLPLLEKSDSHVAADLKRIEKKKRLSPVLLVRGDARHGVPMVIADGYHRICASYYWDESGPIECCIVSNASR